MSTIHPAVPGAAAAAPPPPPPVDACALHELPHVRPEMKDLVKTPDLHRLKTSCIVLGDDAAQKALDLDKRIRAYAFAARTL